MSPNEPKLAADDGTTTDGSANELKNLLAIIEGTTHQLENIWDGDHGSEKYLSMLRLSVERAARITAQLVAHSGREATPAPCSEQPLQKAAASSPTMPRILVVDDDPTALLLFRKLFSLARYEIVTAQSGFECLDRISRGAFDLVVLDYVMPFMDGEETFRRIHSIKPDLPVLLSTGFIDPNRLNDLLASGLAAFLRKPLAPPELLECVAGLLGEHQPGDEPSEPRGIAAAL